MSASAERVPARPYNADWLCRRVRDGWYPKTKLQWERFWQTYSRMLLANDPRVDDVSIRGPRSLDAAVDKETH